ncbi:MAG: glycosyltransferase, partial [Bacteroidetes bacterium]|nr:glycosyltransferase [Bacteroidota bacterium]
FALKEEGIASPSQEGGTGSDKPSGKKKAIETGINYASGELIVTTDGDCRLNSGWLSILQNFYVSKAAKFISAPVSYFSEERITQRAESKAPPAGGALRHALYAMQAIEFAGLIAIGAASIAKRSPNMCNGANIAYPRKIFYQVNGFEGYSNIASGDDEFLMHKIFALSAEPHQLAGQGVYFLKNKEATVFTRPAKKLSQFIAQRKRWASKWGKYSDIKIKLLAIFIFTVNFCLIASIIFVIFNQWPTGWIERHVQFELLILILFKVFAEFVFLKTVMKFFSKRFKTLAFVLIELIHPFYVVFFGCLSNLGGFRWKGRKVR